MRVLVVSSRWDLVGGSERYAGEVVRGLAARGVRVRVACMSGDQDADAEVRVCSGLEATRPDRAQREELRAAYADCDVTLVLSWISNAALAQLLEGPRLVRFVQDHTLFCPGLNKLHADGAPCEEALGLACMQRYWLGGGCSGQRIEGLPSLRRPLRSLSRAFEELALVSRAARVLVASEYMRAEVLRAGLAPERAEVLPYFTRSGTPELPAESLSAETCAFWHSPATFKLFTPARLVLPDKGIDYLLTALGHLPANVRLVIAGEGPARAWLEQKAREEGLASRVHFTGWTTPGQTEAHYAACDAVAFPSVWNEPFGLVGIEAMAHAKPVVAFDVGGVRQWLADEETGILVPRADASALAAAIARLQANPRAARELGTRGAQRVSAEFRAPRHLDRLCELLGHGL